MDRADEKILDGLPYADATQEERSNFDQKTKEILECRVSESNIRDGLIRYLKDRFRSSLLK